MERASDRAADRAAERPAQTRWRWSRRQHNVTSKPNWANLRKGFLGGRWTATLGALHTSLSRNLHMMKSHEYQERCHPAELSAKSPQRTLCFYTKYLSTYLTRFEWYDEFSYFPLLFTSDVRFIYALTFLSPMLQLCFIYTLYILFSSVLHQTFKELSISRYWYFLNKMRSQNTYWFHGKCQHSLLRFIQIYWIQSQLNSYFFYHLSR